LLPPEDVQIQRRDLTRLSRILELLSSDHAGERAAAGVAATAFIKKRDLTWLDILEGGAMPAPKATIKRRKLDPSDDDLKAAESRLRQMQAHNLLLERQISRLKNQLEAIKLGTDLERS
jgi:hypothetical protein